MTDEETRLKQGWLNDANPWTLTASGAKLYFLNPEFEQINVADIVHHLSNICRFTGATKHFYSVAQHSLLVAQLIKDVLDDEGVDSESSEYWDQLLAALLHEAEETYVNDISGPLKVVIRGKYNWIAVGIRRKAFEKYGVDWEYHNKTLKDADALAMQIARFYLMPDHPDWPKLPVNEMIYGQPEFMDPITARETFSESIRLAIEKRNLFRREEAANLPEPEPEAS